MINRSLLFFISFFIFLNSTFAASELIIEPDDGRVPLLKAIHEAKSSVDLVMYGLTDEHFINALIEAKKAGRHVHLLIEPHPYKSEDENNFAISHLQSAHVDITFPCPQFKLTHQKTFLFDEHSAIVMTFNLTHSTFRNERNFALKIDDPAMTDEIEKVFLADSQHTHVSVNHPSLIWSPDNSRQKIIDFIKTAQSSIKIYAQDLTDYQTIGTLAKMSRSGKTVEIITSSLPNHSSQKFRFLQRAGVAIRLSEHLLIHAKVIIIDDTRAILGSINLTFPSLHDNRELSVMISDPKIVTKLVKTFEHDWQTQ